MLTEAEERAVKALVWGMKENVTDGTKEDQATLIVRPDQYLLILRGLELLLQEETI
jgi:hypothetical protein